MMSNDELIDIYDTAVKNLKDIPFGPLEAVEMFFGYAKASGLSRDGLEFVVRKSLPSSSGHVRQRSKDSTEDKRATQRVKITYGKQR
jgi:hypothetical protein